MKKPANPTLTDVPTPGALRISRFVWILAGVLFLGFAANLFFDTWTGQSLDFGPLALVALLAVAGIAFCLLAIRLWKGERSARAQLTWIGLIAALPTLLRMGRYAILAAVVLVAVLLMWTPASIKYFKRVSPKPKRK
ncbi:hypothetical protein [Glutamicibacter arilaitensis]|uniref:hypothetical protein n=1 Tax=Glutamicibacter arilaitensis TaxID=256701 RepID=UPI003850F281